MFDGPNFAQGQVQGSGDVRAVSYGSDQGLYVEFRDEPFYNEYQSKAQGKPVYDTRVMVKIYVPGDKTKVVDRLAVLEAQQDGIPPDTARWPQQFAAYKAGHVAIQQGTPLSTWAQINAAQVKELNAFNIYTIEQLGDVSDGMLDGLGHGARALRDSARSFIEQANDSAFVTKLEAKHASELADMQVQIEALRQSIQDPEKRGPGRPRKEETA